MKKPTGRESGVALLTVLLVVAISTITAVAMATRQQVDIRKTDNLLRMEQAWQYVFGVETWARERLARDRQENLTDSATDSWNSAIAPTRIENGSLMAEIEDLQGRFNINNLVSGRKISEPDLLRFHRLLQHLGHPATLADALVDWMDPDQLVRYPAGAEDSTYLDRSPPYRTADRPLGDISELLLIEGFEKSVYKSLRLHVTALPEYTAINVNSATPAVLASIAEGLTLEDAAALISEMKDSPYGTIEQFLQHPTLAGLELDDSGIVLSSTYFQVSGDIQMDRVELRFISTIHRPGEGALRVVRRKRKGVFDE
ncbi:MAG: type II secretion system minor pseudopilin GspK [Sedimenticola sp.]